MADSRRVVLTGIGALTPLGLDANAFWDALVHCRSGVGPITAFDAKSLPVRIAGEVHGFDAKNYIDKKERKSLRVMARSIQLSVAAAQLALNDGNVDKTQLDPTRFGVEFGAGLIASELEELGEAARVSANCQPGSIDLEKWGAEGLPNITPLWMLKYLPNMLACHVSILHNAQGPSNTITESDVGSTLAIGEAYRILVRGQADFFLVGGGESRLNPLSFSRQCLFQPLSRRNDEPELASRPFDRDRDGMVISEGATVLVMETLEHAQKRGARIYAEVVGFGSAFDRQRSGAGIARAIRNALRDAGIEPEDVDHINAHGLSAVDVDAWEAKGINEVFGDRDPPVKVFAAKSLLGNLGAAAGTTELAASVLALHHGLVPATKNFENRDANCPLAVIAGDPVPATKPYVLKLNFTDMGQCAAIVVRRWE
ncbi:MAG: 3-oxoacyl-[acyl-carrier-protein] synthase 2 [Gemmatales bacterium]|nr:MAG: 3-oxoacyl-[acyl-carrier-protein] synthase 2 [Gemmatales bacterium]